MANQTLPVFNLISPLYDGLVINPLLPTAEIADFKLFCSQHNIAIQNNINPNETLLDYLKPDLDLINFNSSDQSGNHDQLPTQDFLSNPKELPKKVQNVFDNMASYNLFGLTDGDMLTQVIRIYFTH